MYKLQIDMQHKPLRKDSDDFFLVKKKIEVPYFLPKNKH